jgi:hypothetical protein
MRLLVLYYGMLIFGLQYSIIGYNFREFSPLKGHFPHLLYKTSITS